MYTLNNWPIKDWHMLESWYDFLPVIYYKVSVINLEKSPKSSSHMVNYFSNLHYEVDFLYEKWMFHLINIFILFN